MKIKVIYNPVAGNKKRLIKIDRLKQLQDLMAQYQLPADFVATKKQGDATQFAQKAVGQKFTHVLAAGGDGTVSEVAKALVNTEVILGIIPLGTFMNIVRMLAIPLDVEKAIMLVKIGKTRKIDVGEVNFPGGEPVYFLENSGVGMEAELQQAVALWEKGDWGQLKTILTSIFDFYAHKSEITIDKNVYRERASLIEISNGPWTGAALHLAPDARLNDHRLTVSIFHLQRFELLTILLQLLLGRPIKSKKIHRHQGQEVQITTAKPRPVHADAREFGTTPVSYKLLPNALNVITGFPTTQDGLSLRPRTGLDR